MIGLFGQVKDERKPRQKRNLEIEIENLLRKQDLSRYDLKNSLKIDYEKLDLLLKIMIDQAKITFIEKTQKYKKLWGKP